MLIMKVVLVLSLPLFALTDLTCLFIFSYTFTVVQENTDVHWKFQQYTMIKEYYTRPPTPPPFILINHIVLMFIAMYRCCRKNEDYSGNAFSKLSYCVFRLLVKPGLISHLLYVPPSYSSIIMSKRRKTQNIPASE